MTTLLTVEAAGANAQALPNLLNLCSWLILLLLLPIATAALSHFLQLTFEKGMIFRKYYALITYWLWFKPRKKRERVELSHNGNPSCGYYKVGAGEWKPAKWYSWFYKPLGGCIYCNGTWLAITGFLIVSHYRSEPMLLDAVGLFLFVGANYIWTKILSKVVE